MVGAWKLEDHNQRAASSQNNKDSPFCPLGRDDQAISIAPRLHPFANDLLALLVLYTAVSCLTRSSGPGCRPTE